LEHTFQDTERTFQDMEWTFQDMEQTFSSYGEGISITFSYGLAY